MIFAVEGHIQAIKQGYKTETRRISDRYSVGCFYKIQPKRTAKGEPDGYILIVRKWKETEPAISVGDAYAEGCYTPEDFEKLFSKMYPNWQVRWAYEFKWVPKGN